MAEKKSWRDYLDSVQAGESSENQKTSTWRDYVSEKTGTVDTSKSGWRGQLDHAITNVAGNQITTQVNNWLTNHNNYIKGYQDRYSGRKYTYEDAYVSDSAAWLDTITKQKSEYDTEADNILSYLDQYADHLDSKWVDDVKKTITDARNTQNLIIENATKDNEYWAKFTPNDQQLAAGYTADKVYQEWQSGQKQYADDMVYDVNAGMLELEALKKEKEAYLADQEEKRKQADSDKSFWEQLGEWLGTTPDTTLPLGGVSAVDGVNRTTKYDKQIAELEERIERAKYVQGYEGYMDNIKAEDYASGSQYVSTRTDVAMDDALWGFGTSTQYDKSKLFGDYLYDYINKNQDALDVATVNDTASDAYFMGFDKGFLQTMTDDEIGVYNYIYHTEGKDSANAYLSYIQNDLEGIKRAQEQAYWAAYAKENPVGSSVFSTLISPLKGLSYLGQAADMLDDGKMDENAGYNRFSNIPTTIRSTVSTTIENSGKWGKVGSFAYNTGMSMADFLFSTAVSGGNQGLSLAIMGTGAAADATIAAKQRGLDDAEAFTLGTIAGVAEVAMEKISLSAWLEGDMTEGALRYVLKNALSEGAEEAGTSIVNLLADVIIAGDKSEWNMAMQTYIDEGKSPQEAFGLVAAEQAAQIGLDALGGILSGGVIGGGTYAGTSVGAGIQYGDVGKNKVTAQELVTEGLQLAPDNQYAQKMQGKLDKGKTLTGMQVRNILESNQEQITTNDLKKIQKAAEARLTALGQTADVSKVAELATKWATGQELTRAEKRLLTTSQYGSRVANELLPSNIDSGKYSTEWAEEIGTRSVNAKSYNKKAIRTILDAMASAEDPTTYKSLEDRVGGESNFSVSKSGQATIRETGEAISIDNVEVVGIDKGDMSLQVDGKEVKASDIDFADESQSYLFDAVSKIEHITPGAATAIIRDYNPTTGQTMGEYLNGIDEGYTYGYYGYSEADLKAGSFAPKLTSEQMMSAYKLGQSARKISDTSKTEAIKRMRTSVEAEVEKATANDVVVSKKEKTTQQNAKNLTVTYNKGGGKVVDIDKAGIKDAKRSGAVEVAKILHKMGLSTKVEFFSSYLSTDANGNEIRVFLDDNGVEQRAYSGVYRKSDGTIRIDLEAYNGRGLTLNALSHELTHFIQQWSAEKYQVLADFLIKSYEKTDMTMHERVLKEQARLEKIRGKEVSYDEAFDEVVANAMSKMFDDGKLVEKLTELRAEDESLARKLWEGFKKILSKFIGIYEKESALFKDAADLVAMKETFEQLQNMFAEALVEASDNHQASQQIGLEIDMQTESVSPAVMNSEHTWTESDYVQERDKAAKEIAKAIGVSEKKAKDYIDSINSIAKMIAEDRSRLDYFSSPGKSSFVDNAEYGGSFDFSTLCKKRRLLTGTFTAIQKALPNTALTADEILDIRNRMKEANLEVSCGLCYVEGSRANMGQFAKEFLRLYKQYYPDAWQPNMADVNTPDGIEWVRINHPEVYEQYEYFWNHYGTLKEGDKNLFASQQKPKLYQLHTEYKSEILQKFKGDDKVEDKNLNGGIRLQSFSDFEIVHLIDAMQIIIDMSRVGLAGQAYTKVPDFAWALGDTGLKINLSLIAKGVDANGKLIFDDVEGMPIADAMKLRDRYSKNVGTILVAFNDEQLLAAMADDRVDFIIPFHRSQWKKSQYEAMGLPAKTKDYTFMQNEKYIKPQFHEYRGRMVKDKASNYMPNEYWDFSKSGKENAVAYLEMCARNNKRPKFYKLLQNNGDGSYSLKADGSTDGYWKLLIDFKMYDNEGVGSPQMAVKPEFNMEEANRMLNDYKGGHSTFPVAKGIVDSFVKDYKESHKGEQYSSQETDLDTKEHPYSYDTLVSKPDMVVTEVDGNVPSNRADVVFQAKQNAAKVGRFDPKTGSVSVYVNDVGADVVIGTQGLKHGLEARREENSIVTLKAGEILKNSIRINELTPKRDDANGSYVLVGAAADNNGSFYIVRSVVNQFSHKLISMDVLYAINAKKGNRLRSMRPGFQGPVTDSTISVAELLDLVNQYFPDVLPEDVLKHYGYDARPDGVLGKDALYSEHETDSSNRSLLANAFEGITQNSNEYKLIQEYKGRIKLLNEYEAKLSDLNAEIRKILFESTGARDTARLEQLQAEAKQVAENINRNDKKLLSLEASEPLRKVIERERKKEATKTKDHVKEIQQNKKVRAEQTEMRHKIQRVVNELNNLLLKGDKKRHVPENLKKAVAEALALVNMDTVGADERVAKYAALIAKETDPDVIDALTSKMETIQQKGDKMGQRLKELREAYEEIADSDDPDIANAYDPVIAGSLKELAQSIGDTSLRDMSIEQLQDVYDMYKMVLTRVRDANKAFMEDKRETIAILASMVTNEIRSVGGDHKLRASVLDPAKKFVWDNQKPIYAMESIGSRTLTEAFMKLIDGEGTYATDISHATEYAAESKAKHKYDSWDFKKTFQFESASGLKFDLTLEQIMSLYAYSKREQAHDHLRLGGFVFDSNIEVSAFTKDGKELSKFDPRKLVDYVLKYKVNTADAHQITPEILAEITGKLTDEQKAFVDEMQKYLSEVMGAKGNEVAVKMYGVKLFKEKFYFPLKSAKQFMFEQNEVAGEVRIKNYGFTNKIKPKANNPVILSNFMDVWANHVHDMSMYHSFVLPLEDFNRIFNYNSQKSEGRPPVSVKGTVQNAYGPMATNYVKQLITDLNGGARSDPRESAAKALMGRFKKAAVFASNSVWIQQPSAILRAQALVDAKYFDLNPKLLSTGKLWEEVKQYAPVAIIKEMGHFDMDTGRSTVDYIKGDKTVMDKVDDVLSLAPAKADEWAWAQLWAAVKKETAAKHKELQSGSDELLKISGKRFTEVVVKTQVYDSTLSRSANMRSKSALMSMATAFMAEPTTSINMLENGIRMWKRGYKKAATRQFGAVYGSVIANAFLVSIIYAMRDDDEDETFLEKYFGSVTTEVLDGFNLLTYYPWLKDAWSLLQGFDVERSDMSLLNDVFDALNKYGSLALTDTEDMTDEQLEKHQQKMKDGAWSLVEGVASLLGIPLKNVKRDFESYINTVKTLSGGTVENSTSFWDEIAESVKNSIPFLGWAKDASKTDKLYDAIVSGDEEYLARLKSTYKTDSAYQSAVRKALRDNDSRIKEAAQARYDGNTEEYKRIFKEIKDEGKFSFNDIMSAINSEESKLQPDKVTSDYGASDFVEAIILGDPSNAQTVRNDIIAAYMANGKTEAEAETAFASSVATSTKEAYLSGLLDEAGAEKMLQEYADKDKEEAASKVSYWAFCEEHLEYKDVLTEANVAKYHEFAEPENISVDVYAQFITGTKGLKTKYDEWGDVELSEREQVLDVINALPLTWQQKDALYLAYGYKESTIWDVPW